MDNSYDVVVIGGSAAGLTAAITSRRFYPEKSVIIVRKEEKVLIPCGIPYIFGTVCTPSKNLIPDAVLEKNNIELLVGNVTGIDRNNKTIETKKGDKVQYEKLIIATGSIPIVPPISGSEKENVYIVNKDVDYLQNLLDKVEDSSDMVIIGGGFIGMEFADECNWNLGFPVWLATGYSYKVKNLTDGFHMSAAPGDFGSNTENINITTTYDAKGLMTNHTFIYGSTVLYEIGWVESDAPVINDAPSDFNVDVGYTGVVINWTATDTNPNTCTIELQGTGVVSGPRLWSSSIEITYSVPDGLVVGTYIYTVTFTDDYGHSATDTVTMTIREPPPDGAIPFEMIILISVLGPIIVLAVVIFIFLRKRSRKVTAPERFTVGPKRE